MVALAPAMAAELPGGNCGVPRELANIEGALPRTAARIAAKEPLKIVALGSSSTFGTGASGPDATYPRRLEMDLADLLPDSRPVVLNRGVPGDSATEMLARLDRDVLSERPDLVIFQTGTNDIERGVRVDRFRALTETTLARLKAAGTDVILMEPQYYPRLVMKPAYVGYLSEMREMGEQHGVPVLRRFDIMLHWIQSGEFVVATMLSADAFHMKDRSYVCLAHVLADQIAGASGVAPRIAERFAAKQPAGLATALTTTAAAAK